MTNEETNLARVARAALVLTTYRNLDEGNEDCSHELFIDLLCDLQHLAKDLDVDFDDALFTATIHFDHEK